MLDALPPIPAWVPVVLVLGTVAEWALLTWRRDLFFLLGFQLIPPPVPILAVPEGEGETATAGWEVGGEVPVARFWARGGMASATPGLRGAIRFRRWRGVIALDVRWSPPWTPLFMLAWLGSFGAIHGNVVVAIPASLLAASALLLAFRAAAVRAVAELRYAWGALEEDEPHSTEPPGKK